MTTRTGRKSDAATHLLVAGLDFAEIATFLNYGSAEAARIDVEKNLANGVTEFEKEKLRELFLRRYERLLQAGWTKAMDPSNPEQIPAIRVSKELVDRMVVLTGAAAPAEIVVSSPHASELMGWVARMQNMGRPPVEEGDPFALPGDVHEAEIVEEPGIDEQA